VSDGIAPQIGPGEVGEENGDQGLGD
jgi:hypothetical protein